MAVVSVSRLNQYVKKLLEEDVHLQAIYVSGEISNFKWHYASGHLYMTLKDESAAVRAVMFKGNAEKLTFRPEDGMKVVVLARVSLFPRDGSYQLYIEKMQPDGVGALQVAFEQLKKKLAAEGLFDEQRKKSLPRYPQRIGVVTSATGAAVQDIKNVLGRRYPLAQVILCPVLVQGEGAAASVAAAIAQFNEQQAADVLIVGRGGGSIEDLWAFNEEIVARAVAASRIPVISAVGHETDFTICDFVADLRAPTPSAAAELAVPDQQRLLAQLSEMRTRLTVGVRGQWTAASARLDRIKEHRSLASPRYYVEEQSLRLDALTRRFATAGQQLTASSKQKLTAAASKLDALSPLKVLGRGYAIGLDQTGKALTSVKTVQKDDPVSLRLADGTLMCRVTEIKEAT